eukprot:PLAT11493.1.p1 GENE.PLAT11493.1~~PLAT11493.1.p1  ORF type:complete len:835 (-),score=384.64 PLAT11493.1:267-2747(-)
MARLHLIALATLAALAALLPQAAAQLGRADWEPAMPSFKSARLCMTVSLEAAVPEELTTALYAVSTPGSARYGQWLSKSELAVLVAASKETRARTQRWLTRDGEEEGVVLEWAEMGDAVTACGDVAWAERLTSSRWWVWRHRQTGQLSTHPREPVARAWPQHLDGHVLYVDRLNSFPMPQPPKSLQLWRDGKQVQQAEQVQQAKQAKQAEQAAVAAGLPRDSAARLARAVAAAGASLQKEAAASNQLQVMDLIAFATSGDILTNAACPSGAMNPVTFFTTLSGLCAEPIDAAEVTLSLGNSVLQTVQFPVEQVECVNVTSLVCVFNLPYLHFAAGLQGYGIDVRVQWTNTNGVSIATNPEETKSMYFNQFATPRRLRQFYNVNPSFVGQPMSNATVRQAVVEFIGQSMKSSDLAFFQSTNGLPRQEADIIGFNNQSMPGGEASLDIQIMMGIAPGLPTVFDGSPPAADYSPVKWYEAMASMNDADLPHVISTSYSFGVEVIAPGTDGIALTKAVDKQAQKLGARGVSLIYSSGDLGVSYGYSCSELVGGIPSGSPHVTSVGATQMSNNAIPMCSQSTGVAPITCGTPREVACSIATGAGITSSGGFSTVFKRAAFMQKAQDDWLQLAKMSGNPLLNGATGNWRGYPDVSFIGHNFPIVQDGVYQPIDGTSASAPSFAALISLINTARLNNGKPVLGFLNPFLYWAAEQHPGSFNDVVMGSNACAEKFCCPQGFHAQPGWDPVTGLGSPNFNMLLQAALSYTAPPAPAPEPTPTPHKPGNPLETPTGEWAMAAISAALMLIAAPMQYLINKRITELRVSTSRYRAMS